MNEKKDAESTDMSKTTRAKHREHLTNVRCQAESIRFVAAAIIVSIINSAPSKYNTSWEEDKAEASAG